MIGAHCGLHAGALGVVTRLFVAPGARGQGAGEQLLRAVDADLRQRALRGALDVDEAALPAIALYERLGWRHVATQTERYPGGEEILMRYHLAPEGSTAPG